jgi:hypothetical protein
MECDLVVSIRALTAREPETDCIHTTSDACWGQIGIQSTVGHAGKFSRA